MTFFRPSPSRLSPGRNTVFVSVERIVQHLASFPLWGIKREHGPIRSPNCPCAMATTQSKTKQTNRNHKKPKPNKNKTKHQTKDRKTTSSQRTSQLYANCSNLCADDWALHVSKQRHNSSMTPMSGNQQLWASPPTAGSFSPWGSEHFDIFGWLHFSRERLSAGFF